MSSPHIQVPVREKEVVTVYATENEHQDIRKAVAFFASVGMLGSAVCVSLGILLQIPKIHFFAVEFALLVFSLANIYLYSFGGRNLIRPFWSLWGVYVSGTFMIVTMIAIFS